MARESSTKEEEIKEDAINVVSPLLVGWGK